MSNSLSPVRRRGSARLQQAVWLGFVAQAAVFMTVMHMTLGGYYFKFIHLDRLAAFDSVEPFQRRVLTPAIVAALKYVTPLGDRLLFAALEFVAWAALILLAYRALVMFNVGRSDMIRRVLALTVVIPMFVQVALPDLGIGGILVHGADGLTLADWKPHRLLYYPYDMPAAVFTLALALVMFSRLGKAEPPGWRGFAGYLALFALATVNRETTIFLLPFFALLFWKRLPPTRWLGLLVLQIAIFCAVELPLHWLFAGPANPKANLPVSQYEGHLFDNLAFFSTPLYLLIGLTRFAGGLYLPVLLWRRCLDPRIARALLGFCLPLAVFAMIVGRLQEHRIFVEIVPLIWIAALQVMYVRSAEAAAAEDSVAAEASAPGEPRPDTSLAWRRPESNVPYADQPAANSSAPRRSGT